ncbi:MAG: squalene/phytoene synthase family protein [Chloroflexi bacterium]|nr:squalene/phytoene synthase family protein [Chloroflexota bacterium]
MELRLEAQSNQHAVAGDDWAYCERILPRVSRTFALNIARLEGDIYRAVLLGYLFFRIADTFEDTAFQDEGQKIAVLYDYAGVFKGNMGLDERLKAYEPLKFRWREESPEKDLIENGDRVLRSYFGLPPAYRQIIDPHIARTSEGMADFQRRKLESGSSLFQLRDIDELREYCYFVAGIVGEMLTKIFCRRESMLASRLVLERNQAQFGLALQVTNIVKDWLKDTQRGWCYIPASITEKYGIVLDRVTRLSLTQKKRVLNELMPVLLSSFNSTLSYIKAIPESERPIRMFCIIPFVLAYNTVRHVARMRGDKLSRSQVAALLARCESFAGSNELLERDYLEAYRKLA